ncbi:MAG: saccharopine dehydrogenase NADP-binding domain-containing protein [Melioribacteraceae bacterium]|nr:saccharopine dehydrogenase NADP-binding domain-containing protein [Melioribacteraceae bacterium]
MKIVVLGAGLVGSPMAIDLAKDENFDVLVADKNASALKKLEQNYGIKTIKKDLRSENNVSEIISDADYVINAVPGFMGYETLQTIIKNGKDVVDISFFAEDPFQLDKLAKEKGVIAIMDCGVAPGMSNILTGYVHNILDKTELALTYVGGLPEKREWPYEYKAVFSPIDVIEEYTRPARIVENGELVIRPALSEPELLNFPQIGTLEAFNSDGLRSLAKTIDCPNMKEKTLRYMGHIDKMKVLRDTGFFSYDEIEVNGKMIKPIDLTTRLLFPKWKLEEGEVDITVMQIIVEGIKAGKKLRYVYDLYDKYNEKSKIHSMARTTGYTATMAVRMLAKGLYKDVGLSVPEYIGKYPNCVEFLLSGLRERGVVYKETIEEK